MSPVVQHEYVRLIRTVHPRTHIGTLTGTVAFKNGIFAQIVSVEWGDEEAVVTWLIPAKADQP